MEEAEEVGGAWDMEANHGCHHRQRIFSRFGRDGFSVDRQLNGTSEKGGKLVGFDGHKKIKGTKIHAAVTRNSLPVAVAIGSAREHEGLGGKTPAEACGIEVQGQNKWTTLIQNASKKR